jgi:hypothetical protein
LYGVSHTLSLPEYSTPRNREGSNPENWVK